jgi:hypothetical protein
VAPVKDLPAVGDHTTRGVGPDQICLGTGISCVFRIFHSVSNRNHAHGLTEAQIYINKKFLYGTLLETAGNRRDLVAEESPIHEDAPFAVGGEALSG